MNMTTPSRVTTELNKAVAAQIRSLMGIRMVRQSQLAARMGVTEVWLSRRLREVQPMSLDDVERIADGLEVTPTELLILATGRPGQPTVAKLEPADRPPVRTDSRGPKSRGDSGSAHRRSRQKRALTAEELAVLAG